jgi:hypothetical protein
MQERVADRICEALRNAFPKMQDRADLKTLSHEGCLYMRSRLTSICSRDLPYYLVQVLVDATNTHTGDFCNSEDAEAIVRYLNVMAHEIDPALFKDALSKEQTSKITSDREYLSVLKQKTFEPFTKEQASAICEWLEDARNWPELKWNQDQVESALKYWKTKS